MSKREKDPVAEAALREARRTVARDRSKEQAAFRILVAGVKHPDHVGHAPIAASEGHSSPSYGVLDDAPDEVRIERGDREPGSLFDSRRKKRRKRSTRARVPQ
jgi:hypothetical protein